VAGATADAIIRQRGHSVKTARAPARERADAPLTSAAATVIRRSMRDAMLVSSAASMRVL
jgi:hypothetical protein